MSRKVLVYAEGRDNKLRNVSLEALSVAKKIADGGEVSAALFGSNAEQFIETLGHYGADRVFVVKNPSFDQYVTDLYKEAFLKIVNKVKPDVILLGHTPNGKDFAPKVAQALEIGMVSDSIDIEILGDKVIFTRPIYAGKAFVKKIIKDDMVLATIRPNNIAMGEADPNKKASKVEFDFSPSSKSLRVQIKDVIRKASCGVDLSEAKVVISGGRGTKKDGFDKIYELASLLNAAVGASRSACDEGYADYSLQVGQTGKVVTPDLYIAFGISGAIQHVAGMSNSKVIVAVNKDPEAPIFQIADYGIVGDMFEVLPVLKEEFEKLLNEN
ncbi:MAG: electron transfer flavoprotein subunit alpha/FixB family protein [Vulcanibacillus sp.]